MDLKFCTRIHQSCIFDLDSVFFLILKIVNIFFFWEKMLNFQNFEKNGIYIKDAWLMNMCTKFQVLYHQKLLNL